MRSDPQLAPVPIERSWRLYLGAFRESREVSGQAGSDGGALRARPVGALPRSRSWRAAVPEPAIESAGAPTARSSTWVRMDPAAQAAGLSGSSAGRVEVVLGQRPAVQTAVAESKGGRMVRSASSPMSYPRGRQWTSAGFAAYWRGAFRCMVPTAIVLLEITSALAERQELKPSRIAPPDQSRPDLDRELQRSAHGG